MTPEDRKKSRAKLRDKPITNSCPKDCHDCCKNWFTHIPLTEWEYTKLKEHGTKMLRRDNENKPILRIKRECEFLTEEGCSIYEKDFRPMVCQRFMCAKEKL